MELNRAIKSQRRTFRVCLVFIRFALNEQTTPFGEFGTKSSHLKKLVDFACKLASASISVYVLVLHTKRKLFNLNQNTLTVKKESVYENM